MRCICATLGRVKGTFSHLRSQLELALDRCEGRWELLVADFVAFIPDHRSRIRAIKAAAERRANDNAASLERQRRRLSAEAKIEAAVLDEGYPSTPRSDREARPSPPVTEFPSDARATAGRVSDARVAASSRPQPGREEGVFQMNDGRHLQTLPFPVSGSVLTFDPARVAVEPEPTLLWSSIDAAAAADRVPLLVSASSAASVAEAGGTWGAEGYPLYAWRGERDPLRNGEHDDARGGSAEGPAGEEAPLREVIFRLFNDAADAALADAEAQRRRAAG